MTADTVTAASPGGRWADLPQVPILSPEYQDDPHGCHRRALELSPVAVCELGLVALSYDAVRTVLRDRRFREPEALGLAFKGVTSGSLWDWAAESILSLDGEEHHRLRKLVVRAFTPACAEPQRAH